MRRRSESLRVVLNLIVRPGVVFALIYYIPWLVGVQIRLRTSERVSKKNKRYKRLKHLRITLPQILIGVLAETTTCLVCTAMYVI